jgi:hypothetical protein
MGHNVIGNPFLLTTEYRESGSLRRDETIIYRGGRGVVVSWSKDLRLSGSYRMDVEFGPDDIMRLFKIYFGSELQKALIERYGLTFSEEVVASILKNVKLTDVTLGDLLKAMSPEKKDDEAPREEHASEAQPANVTAFPRRRL